MTIASLATSERPAHQVHLPHVSNRFVTASSPVFLGTSAFILRATGPINKEKERGFDIFSGTRRGRAGQAAGQRTPSQSRPTHRLYIHEGKQRRKIPYLLPSFPPRTARTLTILSHTSSME